MAEGAAGGKAVTWLWILAWAAVPVAFILELVAAQRAVRKSERLVEAWLAVGAHPHEALVRVRPRVRPGVVIAAAILAAVLVRPPASVPVHFVAALVSVGIATVLASWVATLRTFVDSRLVDRPPLEARTPFRVGAQAPPAALQIYETRPPQEDVPAPPPEDSPE
jgi:hypothetical protein